MSENTARSIIEAVERLAPSELCIESDEQGRPRVVRLEWLGRPPEVTAIVGDAAAEAASADVDALTDRCVAAIEGMFEQYGQNQRELARIEPLMQRAPGPLYAVLASHVEALCRENLALRNGAAAALRGLVEEARR